MPINFQGASLDRRRSYDRVLVGPAKSTRDLMVYSREKFSNDPALIKVSSSFSFIECIWLHARLFWCIRCIRSHSLHFLFMSLLFRMMYEEYLSKNISVHSAASWHLFFIPSSKSLLDSRLIQQLLITAVYFRSALTMPKFGRSNCVNFPKTGDMHRICPPTTLACLRNPYCCESFLKWCPRLSGIIHKRMLICAALVGSGQI